MGQKESVSMIKIYAIESEKSVALFSGETFGFPITHAGSEF